MILLDTNVVSELLRARASPAVVDWVDQQPADDLCLSAVTLAELLQGVALLRAGTRRRELGRRVAHLVAHEFDRRILPLDAECAVEFADVVSSRRRLGRPITPFDAQIAATARVHGALLATRNERDFDHTGLPIVNPWLG
ncbi:type II toxin-antitoxin system VapC family toxin [Herbiconiux sp. CPCC 205716]|uniref:Ribonuclease VapC n=1 Tax=Herbiconiux gentiana TaxID=2970912 RepID=A0ABT2GKF6_9MICO|nr:type II toxin-antitoxin system VapC family toxin [Herbiconiux gentiana]MCS5715399.1 type II toxin-antitoxin system VapC family toxin [Herbiconiux gentiana]